MSERATIIVEAEVRDAQEAFNSLGRRSTQSIERIIQTTRRGELAATRFGRAWRRASSETLVSLARIDRGFLATTRRMRSRFRGLGGIGLGIGVFGALREQAQFDRTLTKVAALRGKGLDTKGGRSASESLKSQLLNISARNDVVASASDLLGSVNELIEKGGKNLSFEDAVGAQVPIGRAALAFFTPVEDITSLTVALMTTFGTKLEDTGRAIEILGAAADRGGVELSDFAPKLPIVIPLAKAVGLSGPEGIAQLGALFQVAQLGTGDIDVATTAIGAFLSEFGKFRTVKRLAKFGGVSAFDASGGRRPVFDIVGDIVGKIRQDKSGLLASRLFANVRSGGLLKTLAIPLGAEKAGAFGLSPESTFFDLFKQISSEARTSQGLTQDRINSNLASSSVKREQAFNDVKDATLRASVAFDVLAAAAKAGTENPKTGLLLAGLLSAGSAIVPSLIGGIAAGKVAGRLTAAALATQVAAANAAGVGTATTVTAAAGGGALAGRLAVAGRFAGRLAVRGSVGGAASFLIPSELSSNDTFDEIPSQEEINAMANRAQGPSPQRVQITVVDRTRFSIDIDEPTGLVEDEARLE